MKKEKKHYIDNKRFQVLLENYFIRNDRPSFEEIGVIFRKITQGLLMKPCFMNYTLDYKEDMASDATFYMIKYIKRYDLSRRNPFAYFSEIAFKTFTHYIMKQKKYNEKYISIDFIEQMSREQL